MTKDSHYEVGNTRTTKKYKTEDSRKEEKRILKRKEKYSCLGKFEIAVTCDGELHQI